MKNKLTSAAVLIFAGALTLGACAASSANGATEASGVNEVSSVSAASAKESAAHDKAIQQIETCQEALDEAEYIFSIMGEAVEQGAIGITAAADRDSITLRQVTNKVDSLTEKLGKSNYEELAQKCRA